MRTACKAETILPLWDQASVVDGGALAAGYTASDPDGSIVGDRCSNSSRPSFWEEGPADERRAMLVLISEELEKVLRDVARCVSSLFMCSSVLFAALVGPTRAWVEVVCIPHLPSSQRLLSVVLTVLPLCKNGKKLTLLSPVPPRARRRSRCTEPTLIHFSLDFTVSILCTENWAESRTVGTAGDVEFTHHHCLLCGVLHCAVLSVVRNYRSAKLNGYKFLYFCTFVEAEVCFLPSCRLERQCYTPHT